jgi:hypothetical protein
MRRYRNFDLELFDYRRDETAESFRVRVARSPAGEMRTREAVVRELPTGLRAAVQRLDADRLDLAGLIALGEELGELLLPGKVGDLYQVGRNLLEEDEGLRLRLHVEAAELASLPWELAYRELPGTPANEKDARGFVALTPRLSLVRHEMLAEPADTFAPVARPRLVCLLSAACLPGLAPLDLGAEQQRIRSAVEPSGVELRILTSASLPELQRSLGDGAEIFHYAGHGQFETEMGEIPRTSEGKGYLLLEDAAGRPLRVPAEQVGLNLASAAVRLAVLNGCETGRRDPAHAWSGIAPLLVQQAIPAVVANQFMVADAAAIEFAHRFYEKLVQGVPIDEAVSAARLALWNRPGAGPRDFAAPVLYLRLAETSDGVLFPTAASPAVAAEPAEPPPNGAFWLNLGLLALLLAGVAPWLAHRYLDVDLLLGAGAGLASLALAWGLVDRLAGDHLNATLRRWLRRPRAVFWLFGLLLAGGAAGAFAPAPAPTIVLLPFDGVAGRLPKTAPTSCEVRISLDGQPLGTIAGITRQAIVLTRDEDRAAAALAGGDLVQELLALRPPGEQRPQREVFYLELLARKQIEELAVNARGRLRVEIFERRPDGSQKSLFDGEELIEDLEGADVKIFFLERPPS